MVSLFSQAVVCNSLQPRGLSPARLLCPWDFPGKNTGMCCHFLLQGIFATQGLNPRFLHLLRFLHWQVDYLSLSHLGSPINVIWYRHKDRYISQWNRIASIEITPCIYGQMIFNKGAKPNQWGKNSLFNKWCQENWVCTYDTMKFDPYLILYIKTHSKFMK